MAVKINKTKSQDFENFKKECEYWLDVFSLREWRVWYAHEDSKQVPESLAWKGSDFVGRVATIGLSKSWKETDIEHIEVCRCAFHEVCELLISDIESIARLDICPSDRDDLEAAVHSVIRRLEHSVFLPSYKKRY